MSYRTKAILIHSARAVYALNWMDIAPALVYIKSHFSLTAVQLGALITSFYMGISIFQLMGGYLSSFIGDKKTSLIGLLFVGIFAVTSGLSANFTELLISRFFAGLSAALFFSPALSLLASIVPAEKYSFHIGIYNGAFNVGGGIGVIGWDIIDIYLGYRIGFLLGGIITIILFFILYLLFRDIPNIKTERSDIKRSLRKVFSSKMVILLAFIGIGSMVSETIIGQFFVYYLESINFSTVFASSVSSLFLLMGFLGGVIGGYHYSRTNHKIVVFVGLNISLGILLIVVGFSFNYIVIIALAIIMGMLAVYAMSVTYTIIRYLARRDLVSMTLSFVNFVQLIIAAIIPIIFTYLYTFYNYTFSWSAMGILTLAFIPMIFLIKNQLQTVVKSKTSVNK